MNYTVEDRARRFTGRSNRNATRVQFSNIPEEDLQNYPKTLSKYTELLKKFIFWRIRDNIKRVEEREHFEASNSEHEKKQEFNVCKFLEEVLELTDKGEEFGEEVLLLRMEEQLETESNLKFA
jgi:hypothetical protein